MMEHTCVSNYMHTSDAKIRIRLSEYRGKQWLTHQCKTEKFKTTLMLLHNYLTIFHLAKLTETEERD